MNTPLTNDQITAGAAVLDLDKLEALADAATPGEWTHKRYGVIVGGPFRQYTNGSAQSQLASFSVTSVEDDEPERQHANADFCAAFSPATAKNLVALARRAAQPAAPSPQIAEVAELPSIDSAEFRQKLRTYHDEASYGSLRVADNNIIAYIDSKLRDAIAASRRAEGQPAEGAGQAGQVAVSAQFDWMKAERIRDEDHVDNALRAFREDPTADNATGIIQAALTVWTADERAAAPAEHKRVIEFALELAEHENDDAAVSFLKAWNSEDAGYLHANWPDFATQQPSAQKGGA